MSKYLPVSQGLPAGVSGRVAGAHELDPLEGDPSLVAVPVEAVVLDKLPQERDHSLENKKSICLNRTRFWKKRRHAFESVATSPGPFSLKQPAA